MDYEQTDARNEGGLFDSPDSNRSVANNFTGDANTRPRELGQDGREESPFTNQEGRPVATQTEYTTTANEVPIHPVTTATNPDGTATTLQSDKSFVTTQDPNPSPAIYSHLNEDGTLSTARRDGSFTTTQRDGTVTPSDEGLEPVDPERPKYIATGPDDTAARIAARFGVSYEALQAANPQIKAIDSLRVGDVVYIPPAQEL